MDISQMLQNAIDKKKQQVQSASDVKAFANEFTKELIQSISLDTMSSNIENKIAQTLLPRIQKLIERDEFNLVSIERVINMAIQKIKVEVPKVELPMINIPKIVIPEIKIPTIKVPKAEIKVNIPPIRIPDIIMPDEMNTRGWLSLIGWDKELLNNPLPVQIRDGKGNPVNLFESLTSIVGGGGSGGKHDFFTIKGYNQSAFAELLNPDGRVKVEMPAGGSGLTDIELRASSVPVAQVSGSMWSTSVIDAFGSTAVMNVWNADNRLRVSVETGGSGITDAELRASSVPVEQVSGANWSVYVTGSIGTTAGTILNGEGNYRDTFPVEGTVTVASITATTAVGMVDSSGVQYSGSNPVPTTLVSGALTSTIAVGSVTGDAVDDGSAPVQQGGIARTANPTAVAGGDVVKASYDDVGRQMTRPVQARDLIATAYVEATTGTETTLLAASAGVYHDLIYVLASNNSTVAVGIDIRAVTAGNIQMHLEIPANGVTGVSLPVPLPGMLTDGTGNNWTVDLPDITGTTVYISALFSKEV